MRFVDAMRGLGRPRNTLEALNAWRAQHGRGASRALADRLGVSLRQAQRYLRGEVKSAPPAKERAIRDGADRRRVVGATLPGARTVSVGTVQVIDSRGKKSSRRVGTLVVDAAMRAELRGVAEKYAAGKDREAEDQMSRAIMAGYSRSTGDNRTIAPGALTVDDYPGGIDIG